MDEIDNDEETDKNELLEHKHYLVKLMGGDEEHDEILKHNLECLRSGKTKRMKHDNQIERGIINLLELAVVNIKLECYDESIRNIIEYFVHMNGMYSNNYFVKNFYLPSVRKKDDGFFHDPEMIYK